MSAPTEPGLYFVRSYTGRVKVMELRRSRCDELRAFEIGEEAGVSLETMSAYRFSWGRRIDPENEFVEADALRTNLRELEQSLAEAKTQVEKLCTALRDVLAAPANDRVLGAVKVLHDAEFHWLGKE